MSALTMETLVREARLAVRCLVRRPAFAIVAMLSLALAIGATTSIFSVVHALLLRPLPFAEPERLVSVCRAGEDPRSRDPLFALWSYPKFEMLQRSQSFDNLAGYTTKSVVLSGTEEAERITGEAVTADYFSVLGLAAIQGREFVEEDDQQGASKVVVLSHRLWQNRFGGDLQIVGKSIEIDKDQRTVVGVLQPGFSGQSGAAEFWIPVKTVLTKATAHYLTSPDVYWFEVIARLKQGATRQRVEAEMEALNQQMTERWPESESLSSLKDREIRLIPLRDRKLDPAIQKSSLILLVSVCLVLLIACGNVSSLLLARGMRRRKELAVCLAMGATRGHLALQVLIESVVLALGACLIGLLLAFWGVDLLNKYKPSSVGADFWSSYERTLSFFQIRLDLPVLVFSLVLAIATGIILGLVPAIQASRTDINSTLKEGAGIESSLMRLGVRGPLVVAEIAMALILLIGAGLMIGSLRQLLVVKLGFEPERVLTFTPSSRDTSAEFCEQLREQIAGLPEVESVALSTTTPLSGATVAGPMEIRGRVSSQVVTESEVSLHAVSANFFATLRIPILRGRNFTSDDRAGTSPKVLINEAAARRFWPDQDPIGQQIRLRFIGPQGEEWAEIVGIAADVKYLGLEEPAGPDVYVPSEQLKWARTFIVRTANDPKRLFAAVRSEVRTLNRNVAVTNMATMNDKTSDATSRTRFVAVLLALFGGIALMLSAVGVYSIVASAVLDRTREIGIRLALGAQVGSVVRLIMRQGAMLSGLGVTIGLVGAVVLTRGMRSLLYGIGATDPFIFGSVALLLAGLAMMACYIPARRAAKVDPVLALRYE